MEEQVTNQPVQEEQVTNESGSDEPSMHLPVTRVESLCFNCHDNGMTTFMLTSIPHFREVIVSSFYCKHCGFKDTGIQFGGSIQPKGKKVTCLVKEINDLNRQIVKSDYATITVPEIELEIPPETRKGTLSTIEGFLRTTYDDINKLQPLRRIEYPEQAALIDQFLEKLDNLLKVEKPFTFIVDDPSGNSHIENPIAPLDDGQIKVTEYFRTPQQNMMLGLAIEEDEDEKDEQQQKSEWQKLKENPNDRKAEVKYHSEWFSGDGSVVDRPITTADVEDVIVFQSKCYACAKPGEERMIKVEIPYFKEVVLMSYSCDYCGFKNNEIKSGGPISEKGKRIILKVKNKEDLSRDLLKSDTASLKVPEIGLFVAEGSLGGRFTTVEGILTMIRDQLKENPFMVGDSSHPVNQQKWANFLKSLKDLLEVNNEFTFILDDPLANSYIQSYTSPDPDPQIVEEFYERTQEQNDELGLTGMNTKDYETIEENVDNQK